MGCCASRPDEDRLCGDDCCLVGCFGRRKVPAGQDPEAQPRPVVPQRSNATVRKRHRRRWRAWSSGCGGADDILPEPEQHKPQISSPTNDVQMVPHPYRDATGRPIHHASRDLDRDTILRAMEDAAEFLRNKGVTAQAVAIGGAVNTIYLRSRRATHDVDFFLPDSNAPEHSVIAQAARYANRKRGGALGADWLNNATQVFIDRELQRSVAREAFNQGVMVFDDVTDGGGLRVFAAPWEYALCVKLNRLVDMSPRPYDVDDAVVYLREYLLTSGEQSVSADVILGWCQGYRKNGNREVLQRVAEAYKKRFEEQAILL